VYAIGDFVFDFFFFLNGITSKNNLISSVCYCR